MSLNNELARIQGELNAPKNQTNKFGKYNYRSCEDILEAVKPLLNGLTIIISDEMVLVGDRIYVKSTAAISDGETSISCSAFAREAVEQKGMQPAQLTGSTSSYSRKYSLNGLLLIDDNKDADTMDNTNIRPSNFVLDVTANKWINSVKQDKTVLDQINDPDYKAFIKTNAGI